MISTVVQRSALVTLLALSMGASTAFAQVIDDVNPAPFNFFDISGTGAPVALGDDAESPPIAIGFDFPFFGNLQTDLIINSNGFVDFVGGSGGSFTNDCPIAPTSPPEALFAYWDDLDPGDDGALAFSQTFASPCPVSAPTGDGACMIVQFEEFDFFPGDGVAGGTAGTFQVVLFDDGNVLYQYDTGFLGDGGSATIAVSSDGDVNSLQFACDTPASIAAASALEFSAPRILPPPPSVPTLSTWGLLAMMLSLMLAGAFVARRQRG